MEENYIYTDDPSFLAELANAIKKLVNKLDAPLLRSILVSYFATSQRSVSNAAPKVCWLPLRKDPASDPTIRSAIRSGQLYRVAPSTSPSRAHPRPVHTSHLVGNP